MPIPTPDAVQQALNNYNAAVGYIAYTKLQADPDYFGSTECQDDRDELRDTHLQALPDAFHPAS